MAPFNNIKSQLGTRGFEQKAETIQGAGRKGKASTKSQPWITAKRHTQ